MRGSHVGQKIQSKWDHVGHPAGEATTFSSVINRKILHRTEESGSRKGAQRREGTTLFLVRAATMTSGKPPSSRESTLAIGKVMGKASTQIQPPHPNS